MKAFFAAVPRVTVKANPVAVLALSFAATGASFAIVQRDAGIAKHSATVARLTADALCDDVQFIYKTQADDLQKRGDIEGEAPAFDHSAQKARVELYHAAAEYRSRQPSVCRFTAADVKKYLVNPIATPK